MKKKAVKKNVGTYIEEHVLVYIDKTAKEGHRSRCAQIAMILEEWTREGKNGRNND